MKSATQETADPQNAAREAELFCESQYILHCRIDRLFCRLLVVQWFFGIAAALWISPRTWLGATSQIHWHVWAAIFFGGGLAAFPIALARFFPGQAITRQSIAIAQTLTSALLIHLTGGRIETHFHVFGSLAFLAFYRDWKVLLTATLVVAVDHLARGLFWPHSVFGVIATSPWRWLEHAGWVGFEDVFLFISIRQGLAEMHEVASRRAGLEALNQTFEQQVVQRTHDLEKANAELAGADQRSRQLAATAVEASKAKGEFLASMSHEIRTPMNGVLGMLGLLRDSNLTERQREFIQIARSSADNLLTVINDILDFSKIEAGKLAIESVPFNLRNVVEDAGAMFGSMLSEKSIELIVQCASDVPQNIVSDPGRVRQVLTNLMNNAIKFTTRGHVFVKVERYAQTGSESSLKFSIEDTGIGISAEKLPKLFEKFTQADASTTRRFGGTGLGLAICKQLTELMGGAIGATSNPGVGSTFWFTLPLVPFEGESEVRTRPALDGVRVLIVDDNEVNRRVLEEQVIGWRMRPAKAASGAEALQAMRDAVKAGDPFQLAVIDFQMPEMDGEMLAKTIKSDPAICQTQLVMLTSLGQPDEPERLKAAGIFACLVKPARPSKLLDLLADAWSARLNGSPRQMLTLPSVMPGPIVRKSRLVPLRTLVVDDGTTNQKVARLMLETLGCRVDVAANGKEAVEMVELLPYDAVFMDCEMPEMDGYEATGEIRRTQGKRKRIPIIAMTAKAITGDRERCLEAGMDDYISKPVRVEDLDAALQRWAPEESAPVPGQEVQSTVLPATSTTDGIPGGLDPAVTEKLRELAESTDPSVLEEIYGSFSTSSVEYLSGIRDAIGNKNPTALGKSAHALKGAAANIGARQIAEIAARLENLGHSDSTAGGEEMLDSLGAALSLVQLEIEKITPVLATK